jgi:hypothetical protein
VPSAKASLYQAVIKRFVSNGSASHYSQLAVDLGVRPSAARALLHEITAMPLPNWLHPDTDLIASFAPFSNLPTLYRVSVNELPHTYASPPRSPESRNLVTQSRRCMSLGKSRVGPTVKKAPTVAMPIVVPMAKSAPEMRLRSTPYLIKR